MNAGERRPRAVFDCNTLFQAVVSETGPAAEALRLVERGSVDLCLSRPVLREPSDRAELSGASATQSRADRRPRQCLSHPSHFSQSIVPQDPSRIHYPRDPRDEPYVDLAAAAKAQYLVSRDKDLLSLMTGHTLLCKQFRQRFKPLRVLTPDGFLRLIGSHRI